MKLETFKMFCDLVETRSYSRTAKAHCVSKSAVSQLVASLEHTFQSTLVERTKDEWQPTPEGQVLYESGRQMLQIYRLLQSKLQEIKKIIAGSIHVATIYSIGLHELPPYVKTFMHSHPQVMVHVEYHHAGQVYQNVLGNVADMGLVAYPEYKHRLEVVPFRKDELVMICSPQHRLAKRTEVRLKELVRQKFIGLKRDTPTGKAADQILRDHGVQARYDMEFDNIETVKRAVEIDAGVAIVPKGAVTQEVAQQTLVALLIEDGPFYRPLGIIYRKDKVLTQAMREFLAALQDEKRQHAGTT